MKTLVNSPALLLMAALLLVGCEKEEPAAKLTPLQQKLADHREHAATNRVDKSLLKLEATTKASQIFDALLATAEMVQKRQQAAALAGPSPSPAIRRDLDQLWKTEDAMIADAEKLCVVLKSYRPHLDDPRLADRAIENFEKLKASR